MGETLQIILTSALTIAGGMSLLVFVELCTGFFIESIHEQKKVIIEINEALIYYAKLYMNPGSGSKEECDKAQEALRQKASLL